MSSLHDDYYKRFQSSKNDPIKCLYSIRKENMYHFLISGTTSNYKVSIGPKYMTCSCPDYKNNSKNMELLCKHCIYTLNNVLNLFPITHAFWQRRFFTPDEYNEIKRSYKENKVKGKKEKGKTVKKK